VLVPQVALAHLGLLRSTPAHGAHLAAAPRAIRLTFTEAVEVAVARLRLIGPSGSGVPLAPLHQPIDSGHVIETEVLGRLVGGIYRIEWQVVGRDGHPVRGVISYVVAPGATGLADPAAAAPDVPAAGERAAVVPDSQAVHHDPTAMPAGEFFGAGSAGYVIVRAMQYVALLVVIGGLAFALVVLRLLGRSGGDRDVVAQMRSRTATLAFWGSVALLVSAVARLYAQSLAMHGPGEALEPLYVAAMVAKTVWGWSWLLQLAGALTAIAGFAMARRGRATGWPVAGCAGVVLALTPALSGHAASAPRHGVLAVVADALHVTGAAGWLGSLLFVLVVGIPVAMRLGGAARAEIVARLVNAFSPTALAFAGLVTLTGAFAAWLHVGLSSALWTSDYGRTLLIKLAILSLVAVTGAYNWRRVRPALGDDLGTRRMQRTAAMELGVGVLVVIVTAVLVATPPPMEASGGADGADRRVSTPG
jgi:copper transport protein